MSYDLEIRSDDNYSQMVNHEIVREFLLMQPNIQIFGEEGYSYEDPALGLYMEIDLEPVNEKGESSDLNHRRELDENTNKVNCIRLHIPYGHMHNDQRDQLYINLAQGIAQYLGWHLYDNQLGSDIET